MAVSPSIATEVPKRSGMRESDPRSVPWLDQVVPLRTKTSAEPVDPFPNWAPTTAVSRVIATAPPRLSVASVVGPTSMAS